MKFAALFAAGVGFALVASPAFAAGDAAAGEKVFAKCKTCHQVGETAKNVVGPIFIELIQRHDHWSFGEGNFGALFRSIERDQQKRGYLEAPPAE